MTYQRDNQINLEWTDITRAVVLSDKFNIASKSGQARRVTSTLNKAIHFLANMADEVAAGDAIHVGSPYHDQVFLDAGTGRRERAHKKGNSPKVFREFFLSDRKLKELKEIRRAFGLASDREAASFSLKFYAGLCDNLWRGNGFYKKKQDGRIETNIGIHKFAPKDLRDKFQR